MRGIGLPTQAVKKGRPTASVRFPARGALALTRARPKGPWWEWCGRGSPPPPLGVRSGAITPGNFLKFELQILLCGAL